MSLWKTILDKLQIAELKSLDVVEQVMKEEERMQHNEESTVDWQKLAKILLAITLAIFALIAWRLWR
jgi:coenzyme F420-reducing hydrogenase delta subunit